MKIQELLESEERTRKPIVYVDMDGVLADLYNYAAELYDVDHYNQMTQDQWEEFFKDSDAYHLFRDLKPFPTANELLRIVKRFAGGYNILSSPLSFDKEGSMKGKSEWLSKNINVTPDKIIFEHDKYKYAVQPDGTPNILIDDYGVNIRKWNAAGGIAIKYQADEDNLDKIVKGLQHADTIIKQMNKDK
jgi:5'(3')-deoxyribonucleotidase